MRIDLKNPGHMLTNAYAISKSSPNDPMVAFQKSTGPGSTTGKVMNFIEAGKITSAAEKPSISHLVWARYAYDPDLKHAHQVDFGHWLTDQLFLVWLLSGKKRTRLPVEKLQDLAMLCVLDVKNKICGNRTPLTPSKICQHLGYKNADTANWRRTIKPHWEAMGGILGNLDMQVTGSVKDVLLELRFGTEHKYSAVC